MLRAVSPVHRFSLRNPEEADCQSAEKLAGSGVEGELVEEQGIWRGGRATANFISLILNRYNYLLLLIKVLHINNL